MPRTGSNIYKRKDGRWEGRYPKGRKSNGKIIYGYVYAKTYTELKKRLSTISQEHPKVEPPTPTKIVSYVAEQWLSMMTLKVKPSTFASYDAVVKIHILPELGNIEIRRLNTASINDFTQAKLQHGRKNKVGGELSPNTVCDILSILKGILDYAYSEKLIENPVRITYPKHQEKTMRVLSHAEQSVLKQVLLTDTTIYKAGILLCLYTGLRVGEVCGLRWQDFSPNFDKLSVCRSMRRINDISKDGKSKTKIIIDTPKSKTSIRDIPIPKFMVPILKQFCVSDNKERYFLSTSESKLTEPRTMQNHFKRVIKEAKISDANFHCLRHTFTTACIEANLDVKSISEMLGHSNVNITLNRYTHSSFEQKRKCMNKLEQYLSF